MEVSFGVEKICMRWQFALQKTQRAIRRIVVVLRVNDILFIRSVDLIRLHVLFLAILCVLALAVEHSARQQRPGQQVTFSIQSGEEAALLPPNHVLGLVAHTNAVQGIEMGERDLHDIVKALQEGEPISKLCIVNQICLAANGGCELILLDTSSIQSLDIVDV